MKFQTRIAKELTDFLGEDVPEGMELYCAVKLGEEAGEVLGVVQRIIRNDIKNGEKKLESEIGDVLVWLSVISDVFGINIEVAAEGAIKKQERRRKNREKK